jgi:hypothetical protein
MSDEDSGGLCMTAAVAGTDTFEITFRRRIGFLEKS